MSFQNQKNNSFTLIELLMVIAIIAILAGILVAILGNPLAKGRDSRRQADLETLEKVLGLYFKDNGNYPAWTGSSTEDGLCIEATDDLAGFLVDNGYIPQIPQDPMYKESDCEDNPWSPNCHCYIYQTGNLEGSDPYYSDQYALWTRAEEGDEEYFVQESGGEEKLMEGGGSWPGGYSGEDWNNHIIHITNSSGNLVNYQVLVEEQDMRNKGVEPDPGLDYKQLRFFKGSAELAWFRDDNNNYWVKLPTIEDGGVNINLLESTSLSSECADSGICNSYDDVFDKSLAKRADETDDPSLKAEWLMDEESGIAVADTSTPDTPGEDNPGTYKGRALEFDGANDYISFFSSITTAKTQEGWFYFTQQASDKGIHNHLFDNFYQHSANNYLYFAGTGDYFSWAPSINTWYHIVITYTNKADTNTAKLYINGGIPKNINQQPAAHDIDNINMISTSVANRAFAGLIDEIRVYNGVLAETEIQNRYKGIEAGCVDRSSPGSSCLKGEWRFTDIGSSSTTTQDYSGNSNTGTLGNGSCVPGSSSCPTITSAWQNAINTAPWDSSAQTFTADSSALAFNGIDDYINGGNDISLNITNNLTLEAWVKPTSFPAHSSYQHRLVSKFSYPSKGFYLRTNNDGILAFTGYNSGGESNVSSDGPLLVGEWTHIVVTYQDGVDGTKIYLNGALNNTGTTGSIDPHLANDLSINCQYWGASASDFMFNGLIDKVRIYSKVLTEHEIKAHYQHRKCANPDVEDCGVTTSF